MQIKNPGLVNCLSQLEYKRRELENLEAGLIVTEFQDDPKYHYLVKRSRKRLQKDIKELEIRIKRLTKNSSTPNMDRFNVELELLWEQIENGTLEITETEKTLAKRLLVFMENDNDQ